ncbi:3670_t:CDS:2 [Ambispora leptoticha]|uniref:3670_t:CDS:1 n=1 Tax=Ambispora leptoticha TaxID=144679 RepID=A0A9N8WKL5_9GLOM|nr:3670_t:CDS:2 [Ambispora leptoticha]
MNANLLTRAARPYCFRIGNSSFVIAMVTTIVMNSNSGQVRFNFDVSCLEEGAEIDLHRFYMEKFKCIFTFLLDNTIVYQKKKSVKNTTKQPLMAATGMLLIASLVFNILPVCETVGKLVAEAPKVDEGAVALYFFGSEAEQFLAQPFVQSLFPAGQLFLQAVSCPVHIK